MLPTLSSYNPSHKTRFGLSPFSLAATKGITPHLNSIQTNRNKIRTISFSFPLLTEMFHFSRFTSHNKYEMFRFWAKRVSPFGNPRIKGCMTPPRGLSQSRHVLHRLDIPRHPPSAFKNFFYKTIRKFDFLIS